MFQILVCAKISSINCVCHSMNMMKMLNYQFIIQFVKVFT